MAFLRNPEIRRQIAVSILLIILFLAGEYVLLTAFSIGVNGLLLYFAAACLALTGCCLAVTKNRYKRLGRLAADIDLILHRERKIDLDEYREGELAVLANEIQKVLSRLVEQSDSLKKEKIYLSDSLADISHQLKTPLTSLQLLMMRLSGEQKEEERSHLCVEGAMLLNRVDWLVNGLLKIAKIDAKTAVFAKEYVDVKMLAEQALNPLRIPLELREQTVVLSIQEGKTPGFTGDMAWSMEALGNILKNCMEHTPKGGTIQIYAGENHLYTELSVEDNGSGITPEDLPHLFERFYKGKGSADDSVGIGLALARMIIKEQNGTLKAENRREGGARFLIRFYKGTI